MHIFWNIKNLMIVWFFVYFVTFDFLFCSERRWL